MKCDYWNKEFKVLMTLGASITAGGWASCRERSWASQLVRLINEFQRVPAQLVNQGIGANVLSTKSTAYEHSGKPAADERLEKHILSYKAGFGEVVLHPDLLIISYGLNDARGGTPIDLFCAEMERIINRVREKIQPLIVLPGPYYMIDFALGAPFYDHGNLDILYQYNDAVKSIAGKHNALFVDLLASYHEANWLVHRDGVHANDLGHRVVANKIFEVLASNCSGLSIKTKALEKDIPSWRDESTLQENN